MARKLLSVKILNFPVMFFTELSQSLPVINLNHSFLGVKYCSLWLLVYIRKLNMKTSLANIHLADYNALKLSFPL